MKLVISKTKGDGEAWSFRAYVTVEEKEANEINKAIETLRESPYYADTADEYMTRRDAEDVLNDVYSLVGVCSEGSGVPGMAFAHEPCVNITNRRVMVYQSGGLDI